MPTIIHRYTTCCHTVALPPGFCDFLRGTSALYQLSRRYNFNLIVDFSCHPLEDCIIPMSQSLPSPNTPIFESFNDRMVQLEPFIRSMQDGHEYCVICHNFPSGFRDGRIMDSDTKNFVKNSILPNSLVRNTVNVLKTNLGIDENTTVLHIRGGDDNMKSNMAMPANLENCIRNVIYPTHGKNVLIISDNKYMRDEICATWGFKSTGCEPIHLGKCDTNDITNIKQTFVEFILMSESKKIYQWSIYFGSGFSEFCAVIYDIPIVLINT